MEGFFFFSSTPLAWSFLVKAPNIPFVLERERERERDFGSNLRLKFSNLHFIPKLWSSLHQKGKEKNDIEPIWWSWKLHAPAQAQQSSILFIMRSQMKFKFHLYNLNSSVKELSHLLLKPFRQVFIDLAQSMKPLLVETVCYSASSSPTATPQKRVYLAPYSPSSPQPLKTPTPLIGAVLSWNATLGL